MKIVTFSVAQFLYFGPLMHYWFMFLDNLIAQRASPSNSLEPTTSHKGWIKLKSNSLVVLTQMIVDQTIGSVLIIGGFFYFFELLDSIFKGSLVGGVSEVFRVGSEKVRLHLLDTLKVCYVNNSDENEKRYFFY
jgi:hypothetical protein